MRVFLLLIFIALVEPIFAAERAVWVTPWDLDTKQKINLLIKDVKSNNLNTIIAEVRYRGDALYFPNRENSDYKNEESRYHTLVGNNFDPLLYLSDICKKQDIKLIAWVTTFVITSNKIDNIGLEHPYFRYYHWVTVDSLGNTMKHFDREGAFFDPGVPEVQDYLFNVFMDIVVNYQIDGFQLDYIRYPNASFGFNPSALEAYSQGEFASWEEFKISSVAGFVRRFSQHAKSVKPNLEVSAAVFSNYDDALRTHSQAWISWLDSGIVDRVYLMAYAKQRVLFEAQMAFAASFDIADKVVVGVRAWVDHGRYSASDIVEKMEIAQKHGFSSVAFFSYRGIKEKEYFWGLKKVLNK